MKHKILSLLIGSLFFETSGYTQLVPVEMIRIRDPFVLPLPEHGLYYLFGTDEPDGQLGFFAYHSKDLKSWEGPYVVFKPSDDFWGTKMFWAPEVFKYKGKFFLFGTVAQDVEPRGTQIFSAMTPKGPFEPIGKRPQTPRQWECLDGTLYLDQEKKPWMVYCHEWIQVTNGRIMAVRLSEDLSQTEGESIHLFSAQDAPWVGAFAHENKTGYITDGPWLHRLPSGILIMLWSSFGKDHLYKVGLARSRSGKIEGPWEQEPIPLFEDDGGHAMLFRTFEGQLMISLHHPNRHPERPCFFPVQETEDGIKILK